MWKLTSHTSFNNLIWETHFWFSVFDLFTDIYWFDWYWWITATLVITKWNIKASNFCWVPYLKCFGISLFELHQLNYTALSRFLLKNSLYFFHWLAHLYVLKEPLTGFSVFMISNSFKYESYTSLIWETTFLFSL